MRSAVSIARGALLAPAALLASACDGNQNLLNPAGPQAGHIKSLGWLLLIVAIVVQLGVTAALIGAIIRQRTPETPASESRAVRNVSIAVAATVITVLIILVASAVTGRSLAAPSPGEMNINVTGNQWWWNFEYTDGGPHDRFRTANEIHIPTGRPVRVHVTSNDVIHSFWIPNLHGKIDAIPTRQNTYWFRADKPGMYWGQCAEFCGLQHAHMRFVVVAESEDRFKAWLAAQRAPSAIPANDAQSLGREAFLNAPCVLCHTIRGTDAHGHVGPDLTHLASRRTIAAGTLPNTRGNLGGWIVDSHRIKPGNNMPSMHLDPAQLENLLAYLESLK